MKRTIRFARLSFERKLSHYESDENPIERRKKALLDVIDFDLDVNRLLLETDLKMIRDRGDWYFGDVETEESVISGWIGKEKEEIEKHVDEDKKGFKETEESKADVAFFVIDVANSVMAYEFRSNVGEKAPYRILEGVFNVYHKGEEELSISPIVDKEEVRSELDRISRVTQVKFQGLKPTNPDRTDLSKPMDEFLQEGGIDRLFFNGKSDDSTRGINLEVPLLNGGLSLAEEGYGSATISGKMKSGEDIVVTTDEKQIESEVDEAKTDRMYRKRLINEIGETLEDLEN
ncbi:MAG: hypothetical protein U5K70_03415 [Halodesulfurarchaeum sp.]|nr:hypothetical protein [Halodesulfurarchaeum sp.]